MKSTFTLTPTCSRRLTRLGSVFLLLAMSGAATAQNTPETSTAGDKGALQDQQQKLFVKLDQNKDGRISAEEAEDNAPLVSKFIELDYNNDGHLSAEEISDWEGMQEMQDGR